MILGMIVATPVELTIQMNKPEIASWALEK